MYDPGVDEARVTLIFPVYGRFDLLERALRTLECTKERRFRVVIADDGSPENVGNVPKKLGSAVKYPLDILRFQHTGSSTVVVNAAALRVTSEFLAYMNSDVEFPDPEWLGATLDCFDRFRIGSTDGIHVRVGAVGIKQLFPPAPHPFAGQVAHNGMKYKADGTWMHLEERVAATASQLTKSDVVEGVNGCGLFVRHETWKNLGGFRLYPVYGWDDVDFCLAVRAAGQQVVCQREHPIQHLRSGTYGRPLNPLYEENRTWVRIHWGGVIDRIIRERSRPK